MKGSENGGERKLSRMAGAYLHNYIPVNVNQVRKITSVTGMPQESNVTGQYGEPGDSTKALKPMLHTQASNQVVSEHSSPRNLNIDGMLRKATLNDSTSSDEAFNLPEFGSNLFITYFLHALEMERLISLNKELVDESREMEGEIEGEKALLLQANKNLGLLRSELEVLRLRPERLPTPPKTYENEVRQLSDELLLKQKYIEKLEIDVTGKQNIIDDFKTKQEERPELGEKSTMTIEHSFPREEKCVFLGLPKPESSLNAFENDEWLKSPEEKIISLKIPEKTARKTKDSSKEQSVQVENSEMARMERRVAELESLLEQQARIHTYEMQCREKEVERWKALCDQSILPSVDKSPNLTPKGSSYDYIPTFKPSNCSLLKPSLEDPREFTPANASTYNHEKEEYKIDRYKDVVDEGKGSQTRAGILQNRPSSSGIRLEKNFRDAALNSTGIKTQLNSTLLSPNGIRSHPQRDNIRKLYIATHEEPKPRHMRPNDLAEPEKRRETSITALTKTEPLKNFLKMSKKDKSQSNKSYLFFEAHSSSNLKTPLGYSNEQRLNDFASKGT
jgi:hypothetical protein